MSAERIRFNPGEFFVYICGLSWELGKVKRAADEEGTAYFCYYSAGSTAARTPVECMRKLVNGNTGPQCHLTINDYLAFMGSRQQILIREYLTDEELYRGKVNEVPVDLWHRPMESFRILADGCRLVVVG